MNIFSIILGIFLIILSITIIGYFFQIRNRIMDMSDDMQEIIKLLKAANKQTKVQTTILTKMINDIDKEEEDKKI